MSKFDAIVIGSGMVGALAANLLLKQGLTVALIDRSNGHINLSTAPCYDNKVSAISKHSQRLFEDAGVWADIDQTRLTPYYHMQVWDGLGGGYIRFSADDVHLDSLGHLVENNVLIQALLGRLTSHNTEFTSYFSTEVNNVTQSEDRVSVLLNSGVTVEASVLVAADGANSFVRQLLNMPTKEWDYEHHAIVATIELGSNHQHTAWQSFGEEGVLAFLPMPPYEGRHFASIVWSVSPNDAEALLALDEAGFCTRLRYAISNEFEVLGLQSRRLSVPLRQRHAVKYVQANVALIGDAAHTIHPLAGQGANLGFADAGALAHVLGRAKQKGESLSSGKVLRRYQRLRLAENVKMAASMEVFKRLFTQQTPIQVLLRNVGMSFMNKQKRLKNHLIQLAVGLR